MMWRSMCFQLWVAGTGSFPHISHSINHLFTCFYCGWLASPLRFSYQLRLKCIIIMPGHQCEQCEDCEQRGDTSWMVEKIVNRPGVAGAVLQTPSSFIHSVSQWSFSSESSKYHKSQTVRARELTFGENVHPPQHVTCHVSRVTCQVSRITCHVSCVTCHVSHVTCHVSQSGEAYRWRDCYQRGLPRLVYFILANSTWNSKLKPD